MSGDVSGAALVGRVLEQVATGATCRASELAVRLGAARTSVFDAVAQLEAAGFVERDARGGIWPGPAAAKLGYAAFGLAPIAGAVEALLPLLRDDTDARAEIVVAAEEEALVLAHRSPAGRSSEALGETVEAQVGAPAAARVRLRLRKGASQLEVRSARRSAQAVADALSELLYAPER
jgi:DNA-binding IclR family transcriptional regulator